MNKSLRNIKIIAFTIATLEVMACIILGLFWAYDWLNFNDIVKESYLILILVSLLAFNLLLGAISYLWLGKVRRKTDLTVASMVGRELEQAYNFGQIGLLVIDEKGTVLWINNVLIKNKINIIDDNAFLWEPNLKKLLDSPVEATVHVEKNGRSYDVKYLSGSKLFVFRDVTEYDNVVSYNKEQSLALGLITLDNYADVSTETDETNDRVNRVRGVISDYFKSYGVLLRRINNETYFGVCNYASLSRMEKDEFSVLEKVREIQKSDGRDDNEHLVTISIGFSYDFPDVTKLNEMASNAIDVCLSRGGDQAVVAQYDSELKFYGGKTLALENTSKVRVRTIAEGLINLIKTSPDVYVMGHTDMDMDALGSCLGIRAICNRYKKPCRIIYDQRKAEKKTRIAFQQAFKKSELDEICVYPNEAINKFQSRTLLIVVDVSKPSLTMCPEALDEVSKIVVIDHHRRAEEFIEATSLLYIDPSASSACELIAMMIKYANASPIIEIEPRVATLMLSGIFLDSNYFKSKSTGGRTFEAAEVLKKYGADNAKADDYLKDEYEEYSLITNIVSTMKTPHYGVVYAKSEENDIIEKATLAKVANRIMQLKGIHACFVIGRIADNKIGISARSDGSINVQLLCETMGGGGHANSAGAAFPDKTVVEVEDFLNQVLDEQLDRATVKNDEGDKE